MSILKLSRFQRSRMFLIDYYLGTSLLNRGVRWLAGPVLFLTGYSIYSTANTTFWVEYGVVGMLMGIYFTLKPFLWLLLQWKLYAEVEIEVQVVATGLRLREKNQWIQFPYARFEKIRVRTQYYSLLLPNELKLYLPRDGLTLEERCTLERNIKD